MMEPSMTSLRRAPSCRKERFRASCHVRALFSVSCLIFADSSLISGDARARLRRTKALPSRHFLMSYSPIEILNRSVETQAENTSTQADSDAVRGNLYRESVSDNQGAIVRTTISQAASAQPGSTHVAPGQRETPDSP